jgi:hypothetical protein
MSKARELSKLPNYVLSTVAELKLAVGKEQGDKAFVGGYYADGDGGGGDFYWDAVSVEADNGGTIFQVTGTTAGRWKRIYSGSVSVKWFGAKGDGIADDTVMLQTACNYARINNIKLYVPSGEYLLTSPLYFDNGLTEEYLNINIIGDGVNKTILNYTTSTTFGVSTRLSPARVAGASGLDTDSYNVAACIIIFAPNSTNIRNVNISGISFKGSSSGYKVAHGIYAPRIALSSFSNLSLNGLSSGIYCNNMFVMNFDTIKIDDCIHPIEHTKTVSDYGGTSTSFNNVSATNCEHGFSFDNLVYSNMDSSSAEGWSVGNYGFKAINRTIMTLNGFGLEHGAGAGVYLEGAGATSYANNTIGGRTMITMNSGSLGLGDTTNTIITDFGVATESLFSVIKRDASLIFNGGLWIQEFNGGVHIPVSLEYDSSYPLVVPSVDVKEISSFGLVHTDFVSTGAGTKKGIARFTTNGVLLNGTNSSNPMYDKPFVVLKKGTSQTFTSGTAAKVSWTSPSSYFDQLAWTNGTLDGITIKSSGMYRVKVRFMLQNEPVTDSLQIYIKHGGSTWGASEFYGNGLAKQMIEMECIVPVFSANTDLTVECARGAGVNIVIVGEANFNQLIVEKI